MAFKYCFIKSCRNSTENSKKIFLTVPLDPCRRGIWMAISGIDKSSNAPYYCCEDHFDLPNDAVNWMKYKLGGQNFIRLKKDIVPHKYLNRRNGNPDSILNSPERKRRKEQAKLFDIKKKLLYETSPSSETSEYRREFGVHEYSTTPESEGVASSVQAPPECELINVAPVLLSVECYQLTLPKTFARGIQTNIYVPNRSASTQTIVTKNLETSGTSTNHAGRRLAVCRCNNILH